MIDLYVLNSCMYCHKVIQFLDENKIEYNKIDTANEKNKEKLIKLGGKRQVPFMVDNDRNIQMYESEDIIKYLKSII